MAAKAGHLSVLQYLKSQRCDIHALTTPGGQSVLHLAARLGNLEMVEWLLKEGVSVGVKDAAGLTALDYAKIEGQVTVERLLSLQAAS